MGRGLAACWVVMHHLSSKLSSTWPDSPTLLTGWLTKGWVGVDFFFVLSGFIIAMSLSSEPSTRNFVARRFARIFPPFWTVYAITLMVALLVPSIRGTLMAHTTWEWLASLLLIPAANDVTVIGVAWTLQHEVLFYAVAAIWSWRKRLGVGLMALLLFGSLLGPWTNYPGSFYFAPLHWEFLFGALAYLLHKRVPRWAALLLVVAALAWIQGCEHLMPAIDVREDPRRVIQYGLGFALVCLAGAALNFKSHEERTDAIGLYERIAYRLGDWSFALYLLHVPIIQAMVRVAASMHLIQAESTALLAVTVTAACLLISGLFYAHVERPLTRRIAKALTAPV